MRIAQPLSGALALALLATGPAVAAPAANAYDPDVRCVAAMAFVVGKLEKEGTLTGDTKTGITSVLLYYIGKVRGHLPGLELEAEIRKVYSDKAYGDDGLKADLTRCGGEADAMGQWLSQMGKHLQQKPAG